VAYFRTHPETFRAEAIVSFRQIFMRRRASTAEVEAARILAHLQSGEPGTEDEGDPFGSARGSVEQAWTGFGEVRPGVCGGAGSRVARTLDRSDGSAYGWLLVLVTEYAPATLAPFAQVRAAVERVGSLASGDRVDGAVQDTPEPVQHCRRPTP
jgi:hypothetical protein